MSLTTDSRFLFFYFQFFGFQESTSRGSDLFCRFGKVIIEGFPNHLRHRFLYPQGGVTQWFNGLIDEVRVYNRALSQAEITTSYQAGAEKIKAADKTGLVGYWSFDEGWGLKANDYSGQGNTGTFSGATSPTWVNGKRGKALSFDGSNDYVQAGDTNFPTGASARTIGFWIKRSVSGNFPNSFYPIIYGTDAQYRRFGAYGLQGTMDLYWHGYGYDFDTGINLDDTNWHYIVIGYDGVNGRSYKDGVESANSPTSMPLLNTLLAVNDFYIGNSWLSQPFNGLIDEVRVYNRMLSQAEITTLYQAGAAQLQSSQQSRITNGLVGYWSFNGSDISGATVLDRSGQGNNGTTTNTGVIKAAGKVGQALKFDGVSGYVDLGNPTVITGLGNSSFSAFAWIKTEYSTARKDIISFGSSTTAKGMYLHVTNDAGMIGKLRLDLSGQAGNPSAITVSDNIWHHVGVVNNANTFTLYIDGQASGTPTVFTPNISSGEAYIGQAIGSSYKFNGKIDEVRIYNRALSAAEVKQLYLMGK